MMMVIKGGMVVDPSQGVEKTADVLVEDGKIVGIGGSGASKSAEVIEAKGWIVTPGLFDMHVHLREPGREDRETILTGTRAAVAGGFSSVACMPNTTPVNDCEAITRYIIDKAKTIGLANVFPVGAITKGSQGEELAEIGEMVKSGAVAISDDGKGVQNSQIMRRAMEYAGIFDIPILDHCEEEHLTARGCMNESAVSTELGLRGAHSVAEELHVVRDLLLARLTGCRVHICHISARESLDQVRSARKQGVRVTCEVTPHHLTLNDESIRTYDTNFKMNPPLRSQDDVEAMLNGLADGTIDCIATDHAPHNILDKEVTFEEAANGVIGLESAVSLVWEFLVRKGVISVSRAVELLSLNPSRILGVQRGTLQEGAVADITLIDPELPVTIDVTRWESKSRNCPYHGWKLTGAPAATIVGGRVVYRRSF